MCHLVDKCIKKFFRQTLGLQALVSTATEKDLVIALPDLSILSLQICTRSNLIMKQKLLYCNVWFVFQTRCKISNFFVFKNRILSFIRSAIVYKFQCGGCNANYYDNKSKRNFKVEYVNTWEFQHSLRKELKMMIILLLKNIFYSAITPLIQSISQFSPPTTRTLKLP